jgi:hypothetical protein
MKHDAMLPYLTRSATSVKSVHGTGSATRPGVLISANLPAVSPKAISVEEAFRSTEGITVPPGPT